MIFNIADLFCGAGGTSAGAIEAVSHLGFRPRLTAINHWPVAIETHTANQPEHRHFCTGIDAINPRHLFDESELNLLWASPECTHHSRARGGRPMQDQSRATAWCVTRWAEALRPPMILIENVPEFLEWGPLGANGIPLKSKKGETFKAWKAALESLGYKVDHRLLCAANYGDPTSRTRLFVQAVRGRRRIVWPSPTHSKNGDLLAPRKFRAARECIDFSIESRSIFARKKPLSPKTVARIKAGLKKFGLEPFIAAWDHQSSKTGAWSASEPLTTVCTKARHGLVQPFLIELRGGGKRDHTARDLEDPAPTVTAGGKHLGLVEPFLIPTAHGGKRRPHSIAEPMPTVCGNRGDLALIEPLLLPQQSDGRLRPVSEPCPTIATAGAIALVEPFLVSYYGNGSAFPISDPVPTVTTKERFGLVLPTVEISGKRFALDIHFRMLEPHELALAQGFPKSYKFAGNKTEKVKQIGNAVPRRLARAIVAAVVSQSEDVSAIIEAEDLAERRGA